MPKKILIINEDPSLLEFLSQELSNHDYSVATSLSQENSAEKIKQENPDLVLLDYQLSQTSNIEISRYLNENKFPFIFISNSDEQSVLKKAYTSGALGFLLNPININQLIIEIETAFYWHAEKLQINRRKENINATIENNRKISVAIGLIMERHAISGAEAFESIRFVARSKQCRILDIAIKLIEKHHHNLHPATDLAQSDTPDDKKVVSYSKEIVAKILKAVEAIDTTDEQ